MSKDIRRIAKKFIKHKLHYNVEQNTIVKHLNSIGYTVTFYNPNIHNDIIDSYGMTDLSRLVDAFTVCKRNDKFVFLQRDITDAQAIYSLLHEVAHIELGHLVHDRIPQSERIDEMEAEVFVYEILSYKRKRHIPLIIALCIALCASVCICIYFANPQNDIQYNNYIAEPEQQVENVYITPTGRKFHRASCMYVQNKNCAALLRDEAEKNYEPCKVCNP